MAWQHTPYTIPLIVAAAISALSAFYVTRRRPTSSSGTGVVLLLAVTDWIVGYALELASINLAGKVFWAKIKFVGISIIPTAWLIYALQYTGREKRLTRRILAVLGIVPLTFLLLVFTNEAHGLIWRRFLLDTDGPTVVSDTMYGAGLWAYAVYAYILILAGIFLLIQALIRSGRLYRWQASALLFTVFSSAAVNVILDLFGLNPFPHLELTPFVLAPTLSAVAWSLYRLRLRDIVPVARDAVIEGMSDGVVVLDAQNRVVDLNPTAQRLFGRTTSKAIGQPVEQIWPEWPGGMERSPDEAEVGQEITLGDDQRTYDVRFSLLNDWRGRLTSQVIVLRDITERKRAEEELERLKEFNEDIVQNVAEGIALVDAEGYLTFVNPALATLLGYESPEELLGQPWMTIVPPDQHPIVQAADERRMCGKADHYELELVRQDGTRLPVLVSGSPRFEEGRFMGTLGAFTDITELKQRTAELSTMLEATRAVSSTLDLEKVLVLIADEMVKATGVDGCTLSHWDQEAGTVTTWVERRRLYPEWADKPGTRYALDDFPATQTVLKTRQPIAVYVSAPGADPAEVAHMRRVGTASLLMLPLAVGNRVIGLVELDDEHERDFTAAEIRLCQALADQVAVAIENARLHAETQRRLQEQTALREASAAISSSLDLQTVLSRIAEQMGRAVDATSTYISIYERETMASTPLAEYIGPQACPQERASDLGVTYYVEGDVEFVKTMQAGKHTTSHIDDPNLSESERAHMQQYGGQTILYIPLLVKGQFLGFAELWESRWRREFTPEEIALAQGMAQQAAIALENARLYEQAQQEIAERKRAEDTLKESEAYLKTILDSLHTGIIVIDPATHVILDANLFALEMFGASRDQVVDRVCHGFVCPAEIGRCPITDLGQTVDFSERVLIKSDGKRMPILKSVVPVTRIGQELLVESFVDITERKQAEEQIRQRTAQLDALRQVGLEITAQLDLDSLLHSIVSRATELLGGTVGGIYLYRPERDVLEWVLSLGPHTAPAGIVLRRGEGLSGKVWETGESLIVDDYTRWEGRAVVWDDYPVEAVMGVPVRWGEEFLGVLNVAADAPHTFSQGDAELLNLFATQAAIAIRNARLYEQAQQEIEERKRAEEQIKASLQEKEVLLKEIHHRVKNNLQVISSLLYLQSKSIKDEGTLQMFQDSQNRVRSMALVHERLYQSQDLARIDFAEYIRNLANHLFRSYNINSNLIQLMINVEDVFLGVDTAVPCGLILNELVSNSLKHAFPHGGEGAIHIDLRSGSEAGYTLMVSDDGIGLPEDLDFRNTESLGLQLVNTLVGQLEGTIELDRNGGTTFRITFVELK